MLNLYHVDYKLTGSISFRSWLAVFGASLALFSTVGFVNAFGVFQERFRSLLQGSSDSDISWIGSTGIALMSILSPAVGIIVDKYGPTVRYMYMYIHLCMVLTLRVDPTMCWQSC